MQELVVESLVVSLTMVMLDVLVDDEAQMPLAERDDAMEALFFDRPDEPLGIGVEIRTLRRQPGIVRLIRLDPKNLQSRTIRLQVDATRPGRRLGLV